jgi:PST family polysaccharide transporter
VESTADSVRFALRVYGNYAVSYVGRNLDKMLLGRFHGTSVLGNYDRAYYLSTMPANQLVTPLHNVALSTLSRLRDDRDRFLRYYLHAISTLAFLGMFTSLVLVIMGKEIICLFLGPQWEEAGRVAVAFGPGVGAMLIYSTCSWLHLSLGKPERWLRWSIASSIATAVLFVIAAPLGAVTLATAYSFSFYLYLIPATWYAGMPIRLGVKPLCLAIWHYIAAALTTWVIWATSLVWIPDIHCILNSLSALQRICVILPAILSVYVLLVVGFQRNADSLRQLSFLVRTMIGKGKTV